jgi:hypothetical protein
VGRILKDMAEFKTRLARVELLKARFETLLSQAESSPESDLDIIETKYKLLCELRDGLTPEQDPKQQTLLDAEEDFKTLIEQSDPLKFISLSCDCLVQIRQVHAEILHVNSIVIPEYLEIMRGLDEQLAQIQIAYREDFRETLFRIKGTIDNVVEIVEESGVASGFITPDE